MAERSLARSGAAAPVSLDRPDLAAACSEAAGGNLDVVIDYLCGLPAETALGTVATSGRMVQVGSALVADKRLLAQTARRPLLDSPGFACYHAPQAVQAQAYAELSRLAVAESSELEYETLALAAYGQAWTRQKAGSARPFVPVP